MEKNILYIQSNEDVAESFREKFAERGIELIVAASASEAFQVMREREITLLLIDINIPDMRLRNLVEVCTRDFPGVILNVCVDVLSPLLITKLVNRHRIHKIFVAPWNVDEMMEEIEDSIECAQIMMDKKIQEQTLYKGREEFQQTLDNLTAALKKQQYSYYKLNMITQLLLTQMKEFTYLEMDEHQALYDLVNEIFTTMLKMQTTGAGNIGRFEETVSADLKKIGREHPGFTTGEISSCLIGDILKVKASNIRFVIWMLARYGAAVMKECRLTVSSHFVTATKAMFEITLHGELSEKLPDVVEQMVQELLAAVSMSVKREEREGALVFHIEFLTAFADEAGE